MFVHDWIQGENNLAKINPCPEHLVRVPSLYGLLRESLKWGWIGSIARDLRYHTLFHQNMRYIALKVDQFLSENEFDLIHAHQMHTMGIISGFIEFHPTVISTWGSDLLVAPKKYPYYNHLYRMAIKNADLIQTSSCVSKKHLIDIYPKPRYEIFVSSWGVDSSFFRPNIDGTQLKQDLSIPDGKNIISFRALEPLYRIDMVIKAFNILLEDYEDLTLLIGQDGSLRNSLENLCKELGIREQVRFIGTIYNRRMAQLFSISDIYVQCPISDGVSVSAMQALASGLPIVANPVGETEAVLIDEYNGLIVQNDCPEGYSEAIRKILEDDSLYQKMSRNSRKLAVEKHDRKKFLETFFDLIHGIVR